METIRNYLESMFKNLPQTDAVIKAKYELGQMMEDKYTELIKEGKSENEAVGVVIAEFGNLEELAADLGIGDIYNTNKTVNRRKVSLEEVGRFLEASKKRAYMVAAGIALCISCVTGPIMSDACKFNDAIGVVIMFTMIAVGVALFIISKNLLEDFEYLDREPCAVDVMVVDEIKNKRREYMSTYSILMAIGVLLCVFCFIPAAVFDEFSTSRFMDELSGAILFWFVSAGVFLINIAKKTKRSYERIISLNGENVFSEYSGNYKKDSHGEPVYKNKKLKAVMSVYWSTVTCIYLIWSFMTFDWHFTWIIWPVAAVINTLIRNLYAEEEE